MKRDIFKDKNNKISSKRVISYIFVIHIIISYWVYAFYGIGSQTLISLFLTAPIGISFACTKETKS